MTAALARTYGTLTRRGAGGGKTWWSIDTLEPHVAIRLKQLFPRIPKAAAPPFTFPVDAATEADLDWFLARYPLAMSAADRAALTGGRLAFEQRTEALARVLRHDYAAPAARGLRDGQVLRPYQAQAVALLEGSGGLLLGDEVGLGKTYTAAAACLSDGALPAVVVCHAHLQAQWVRVIQDFTILRAYAIGTTKPYPLPPADVYVFRYSNVLGWADTFEALAPGLVVFDEVQELRRGTDSQKGQACRRLATAARRRLGLSATPIYNYGIEIYTIMEFLKPGLLGSRFEFLIEWCRGGRGVADPDALGSYLRDQFAFLRRSKRDVGQQVPAVNRIVDIVESDGRTLESVEARARALALRTTMGSFTERGTAARELDMMIRHATGVAKARAVADVARMLVEGGAPIVLVGWHRDVYDIWLKALADLNPALYTGSETAAAKGRSAQAFLAGDTDLLILSLRSGAGLDGLQARASTIVFGELDWSPGVHHQCIGRLDREGQPDRVTALFLVADDGSDPPMMEVLGLKASQAAHILDPGLGVTAVHSDYTHIQRLAQRYLERKGRSSAKASERPAPAVPSDLFTGAA